MPDTEELYSDGCVSDDAENYKRPGKKNTLKTRGHNMYKRPPRPRGDFVPAASDISSRRFTRLRFIFPHTQFYVHP